jgi:glycosyltransferase involved in cell wall biosynthesis
MSQVSVIIPTYNRAEFLRPAITSVLNQTYQDFEIVVVDDGSRDNTQEVVSRFNNRKIRYVRHETNKGVTAARNTGVLNSNGAYIAFLDDDDEWLPQKLARQMVLLGRSPLQAGAVYTGLLQVDHRSGKTIGEWIPTKRGDLFNELCFENCVGTASTVLLKKECFNKLGLFDEDIRFGEEYDMWIRVSKTFLFECVNEPLVKYRVHAEKLSTNYELVISGLETQLRKHGDFFASNKKGYSCRYLSLGTLYCYTGNMRRGREAFLKAITLYPCGLRQYYNLCISFLSAANFKKLKHAREFLTSDVSSPDHLL